MLGYSLRIRNPDKVIVQISHCLRAKQAAEKLTPAADFRCFVTGHDFSRADKVNQINGGLQPLQKLLSAFRQSKAFFRSL
jgi:hypothetical protein